MNNLLENFKTLFKSSPMGELLKTGIEIKKADLATSKRVNLITALSCIGMGVLGFIAFGGIIGCLVFVFITYTASIFFNFSMKKKVLLAYLKLYREKLAPALSEDFEKTDKPRLSSTLNALYPNTMHHWTVCYAQDELWAGFVRVLNSSNEDASGFAALSCSKSTHGAIFKGYYPALCDEFCESLTVNGEPDSRAPEFAKLLEKHFDTFALVFCDDYSLLFSPSSQDFMSGRVSDKDDLKPASLARQYAYFKIAKAFGSLDTELLESALELFDSDFDEETEFYKTLEETKK